MAHPEITLAQSRRVAPKAVARPLLAWFAWSRGLGFREVGEAIGVSHEQARLYCRPFGDPKRVTPDDDVARRIAEWSGHVVAPWTFEDTPGARAIGLSGVPAHGVEAAS